LQSRIGTRKLATVAIFAALYAVLNLIPVSRLVGSVSFLTMANVFSPVAGMLLGPFTGGLSVLIGTFVSFALGKTVAFDGLDFIPGVIAAVTAGYAIQGKVFRVAGLSLLLFSIYLVDPLSAIFIQVGSVPIPYLWMHFLAAVVFVVASLANKRRAGFVSLAALVVSIVFVSTMNAHVAGGIMAENVLVRINHFTPKGGMIGYWTTIFAVYPVERVFFTIVGSVLAIGVLKALPEDTIRRLRRTF
jgi:hypothetical protein